MIAQGIVAENTQYPLFYHIRIQPSWSRGIEARSAWELHKSHPLFRIRSCGSWMFFSVL